MVVLILLLLAFSCRVVCCLSNLWFGDFQDHAKAVSTLQKLNVPYLCTVPLVFQSFEEWQASELGLHPIQVALQVCAAGQPRGSLIDAAGSDPITFFFFPFVSDFFLLLYVSTLFLAGK